MFSGLKIVETEVANNKDHLYQNIQIKKVTIKWKFLPTSFDWSTKVSSYKAQCIALGLKPRLS